MVTAAVVAEVLPQVQSNTWFFDSELLLRAEADGYRIAEVPVRWVETRFAERPVTIPFVAVALQYIAALKKMRGIIRRKSATSRR